MVEKETATDEIVTLGMYGEETKGDSKRENRGGTHRGKKTNVTETSRQGIVLAKFLPM